MLGSILVVILNVYFFVLVARLVMDFALSFNRGLRPSGAMAVAFALVFALTDPLLKPLRRLIPPLRIGSFALDLSFLVLFIGVQVLAGAVAANL